MGEKGDNMKRISVIVPVYNVEKYIRDCDVGDYCYFRSDKNNVQHEIFELGKNYAI